MNRFNHKLTDWFGGLLMFFTASLTQVIAQEDDDTDIYEFSPFTIIGEEDRGYTATNTLAGTRLKTDLRDLAGSISVVTEEFLEDTSSTNTEDLFLYTMSTESSGPDGNFGNDGEERRSPTGSTRVRGLTEPDRTRAYFLTDIGWDSYNTNRVTIAKGPNAILFGLGSPAGIVNNNLKQAIFEDRNQIKLRYGSWGAHREILDVNRELMEGVLAFRIIGLNNQNKFKQKPSFEDEQRLYATLTAKLAENTILRANLEVGSRDASRPPIITPNSNIPDWIANGMPLASNPVFSPGFSNFGGLRVPSYYFDSPTATETSVGWNASYGPRGPDGLSRGKFTWDNREDATADTSNAVLADEDRYVFDFRNNTLWGRDNIQDNSFEAFNIQLEQTWLEGKAGIELVVDEQSARWGWFDRDFNAIRVDTSQFQPYFLEVADDGTPVNIPNPEAGRPYLGMWGAFSNNVSKRDAWRATAFYDLDFRDNENYSWLGRHVFTGLLNKQARDLTQYGTGRNGSAETIAIPGVDSRLTGARYLGPPITGTPSSGTLANRITVQTPRVQQYSAIFYDRSADPIFDSHRGAYREATIPVNLDRIWVASLDRQEIESAALIAQSYFWDDHIVATYGWREDKARSWLNNEPDRSDEGVLVDSLDISGPPVSDIKDSVFTYGVVAHLPKKWSDWMGGWRFSLHYSDSENFVPSPGRITVLNKPHPSPAGSTEEYGFSIETPDNRFYARFNWYETVSRNQTDNSLGPASLNNWERLFYNTVREDLQFKEPKDPTVPMVEYETWEPDDPRLWPNNLNWPDLYVLPPQGFIDAFWFPTDIDPSPGGTPKVSEVNNLNVTGVSDFTSKGLEIEGVWNPTENWSIAFNAAQSEVIKNNVLRSYIEYFNAREPEWVAMGSLVARPGTAKNFDDLNDNGIPDPGEPSLAQTIFERTRAIHWNRLLAEIDKEGSLLPEIREWRYNIVTNYRFAEDSRLKGYAVGAAYRWQDDVAVGFRNRIAQGDEFGITGLENAEIIDVNSPLFGPTESNLDVWISHRRKIFDGKVDWRLQLNIRNVLNNDDLIITRKDADDVATSIRIMNPINFRLTSTFSF